MATITNQRCVSWPRNESWGRDGCNGRYHYFNRTRRLGHGGLDTAALTRRPRHGDLIQKEEPPRGTVVAELSSWARCMLAPHRGRGHHGRGPPTELPDSGGALPRAQRLNTERRAATASPRECTAGVRELHRMAGSSAVQRSRGPTVAVPQPSSRTAAVHSCVHGV